MTAHDSSSSLGHVPAGKKWEFDAGVTAVFDDMLARSIPQYEVMRAAVTALAARFVRPGTDLLDIGCSRGMAMATVDEHLRRENIVPPRRLIGLEVSQPMLDAARARFARRSDVDIRAHDLRRGLPDDVRASVILSVLTLQFTPIEYRNRIVYAAWERLEPGGALILVEKVLGADVLFDNVFVESYHAQKRGAGYSAQEVERKAMALEGVLVPVTAHWNEDLLHGAGFRQVDCFWRWMNFAGWLAVKG